MSTQDLIRTILATTGNIGVDPRHVEAYMRLERGTLDSLGRAEFQALVVDIVPDVQADPAGAEALALSFGMTRRDS